MIIHKRNRFKFRKNLKNQKNLKNLKNLKKMKMMKMNNKNIIIKINLQNRMNSKK
jgi:hypothetical protein